MTKIKGIDISHFNNINWPHLSPEVKFVICKATQGVDYKDAKFNEYWQHLKGTDICRGAYHFLTVSGSATNQAKNFLSINIDFNKNGCLPPILDVENQVPGSLDALILADKKRFVQLITDWLHIIKEETGRDAIIYSYKNFFSEYLNNVCWPNNKLWLASYQNNEPGLPKGYTHYDFWQYSQYGTIDGRFTYDPKEAKKMGADLDLDYFNGTLEQLKSLSNQ